MAGLWPLTIKNGIFTEAEVRDAKIGMATYWLLHCGEKRRISWTGWVGRMGGGGEVPVALKGGRRERVARGNLAYE